MQFVSAKDDTGGLKLDVNLSNEEISRFRTHYDGSIRRSFPGIQFFHPTNHPVKNRLRLIIPGQRRAGESVEVAGQRVYDELKAIVQPSM